MTGLHAATGGHEHHGGPVVVLVHGAGGNRSQWAVQARHLAARGFDVLALDLPGHGDSPDPACDRVEDYAAAVVADMDARGVDRFAIVGHSMGAMIALAVAAAHPERVTHLGLVGAGMALPVNPELLEATHSDPHLAAAAIVDWGHSSTAHLGGSETPGLCVPQNTLAVIEAEIARHPGALHSDFSATAAFDGSAAAAAVAAPCLIVAGRRDLMTPPALGRAVGAAIEQASVQELDHAGHFLMSERPNEVSQLLVELLSR